MVLSQKRDAPHSAHPLFHSQLEMSTMANLFGYPSGTFNQKGFIVKSCVRLTYKSL